LEAMFEKNGYSVSCNNKMSLAFCSRQPEMFQSKEDPLVMHHTEKVLVRL